MAAKGRLQGVGIERHEQVAQGVHRWRTSEPGTEEGVEALAVDGHEGDMLWYEVAPDSTAKTENSSRWLIE